MSACLGARGAESEPKKPVYAPVKSMSPEEFERMAGDSANYQFDIAALGGLVAKNGEVIMPEALPGYLREQKLATDAYYILWITAESPAIPMFTPTIKALGEYGITKIVIRARPGVTPKTSDDGKKNVTLLQGKPNPGSLDSNSPFPALENRPAELRPEPLPKGVRYKLAPDAEVKAAAQRLTAHFLTDTPDAAPLFSATIMVQPGAWQAVHREQKIDFKAAKPMGAISPAGGRQFRLEGASLSDAADGIRLSEELRKLIQADGGGTVRALRATEMRKWWQFIAFDIEEPALMLETAHGKYRFIFEFSKGKALLVDELERLPGK